MPDVHAKLSASGSKQWLASPGTIWMEEGLPNDSSPFAAEGTTAHSLVELKLKLATGMITKTAFTRRANKLKQSEYYNKSMDEYTDDHVNLVMEAFNATPDASMDVEQRVDFSEWVPGGFGTADTIIFSPGKLQIWDLKYGKGVPVDAHENPQLKLYALGAWAAYNLLGDIDDIKMTIDQPRLGSISDYEMTTPDLLAWANDVVKPAAQAAINGEPKFDFSHGDTWRFYRAAGFDRHLAEQELKIKKYKFKEANSLKPEEIADILDQAPQIKRWLQAVEDYALDKSLSGDLELPGYKVVEGRSNRVITDSEKAVKLLTDAGFTPADIYRPEQLKTITQLQGLVGKSDFDSVLGAVVEKPQGKPTLVLENDKRPPISGTAAAQNDFDDEN